MRNAVRFGCLALISVLAILISISCSNNSTTTYSIEGSVTPAEAGSVTPATGEYDEGAEVEVRAEANETWMFSSWEGDISGTENPVIVTVDDDLVFTAVFEKLQFPLNVNIDGGGTVEENIVQSKMTDYEIGTEVELNAVADEGWVFVEWQGDLSGTENPKSVTVTSDLEIIAIFGGSPEVETAGLSDMRINSVTGGGEVTDNGGFEVTDRGVCWSNDETPNLSDHCTSDGSGTGSFSSNISGLTQGAAYYVRAYATNQAGTNYGDAIEFTAGYVSHGYVEGVTPSGDSSFEHRSYPLVKSEWKGGVGKIWIERNLGATGPVKNVDDTNGHRAGWYFQFNRKQGYYHDGSSRTPGGSFDPVEEFSNWEIENDPCRAAFGGNWRVPTRQEWEDFRNAPSSDGGMAGGNYNDAFDSLLRLHAAGALEAESGDLVARGTIGYYWSSDTVENLEAWGLMITSSGSELSGIVKGAGLTIRCVKD